MSDETPIERRLREMAEQLESLAHADECRAAEDDIDDAWRRSRLDSAHGVMTASEGDYVIKGVKGEFYPCKPDVFAATYEAVEEPTR